MIWKTLSMFAFLTSFPASVVLPKVRPFIPKGEFRIDILIISDSYRIPSIFFETGDFHTMGNT